ncbi:MAG: alpha/beta hydrolase [Pseudomonadota bacterium]
MKRIRFDVDGDTLVGDLHLPEGDGPHPGVITGGPMTSVKEQVTGTYAKALADRGIAALAIDHRYYGESGGTPRQYEHYPSKIADLRAALAALATQPEVNAARLGAVGICLGSGYLAHAIRDHPNIKAFAAIAGYYRDVPAMKAADPDGFAQKVAEGHAARTQFERTGLVQTIPAVALDRDAAMMIQSTHDYYAGRAAHPNYTNAFAVMSREYFLPFDVQSAAPGVTMPFLQIHGPNALNPVWAETFYAAVPGEKERFSIVSKGQTDIYDDPQIVATAADRVAGFLLARL